jgi:hypothetical protein
MKTPATIPVLLALGAFLALPLHAQYDMPDPNQGPPPQQGQQAPPPPDPYTPVDQGQGGPPGPQGAPDQQGGPGPQAGPDQGAPDQSASFQTFYDNLAQQGTWIQSSDYGYVWQPSVNDPNWAPYTAGHWVYSDAGWTWASDEPWGWATYHYGRWVNLDGTGWCWVPGYTWAPAWVSWRYGDGYCGWAPLPPDSFIGIDYSGGGFGISVGFHIGGDCDSYYGIGAGCYNFIPCTYLGYSNYHGHYANRYNNYALINRTTNVTNLNVNQHGGNGGHGQFGRVTTGGPSLAQINAVSQTPVQQVRLTNASHPGGGGTLGNNSLALFAPRVAAGASAQPTHVNGSIGSATVNRGVDVTRPLVVNRSLAAPAPTQSQIQAAQLAQFNAPPHAKVVTTSTPVTPLLQTPLTTMKPVAAPLSSPTQAAVNNTNTTTNQHGNSQGKSFYEITHPGNTPSNNQTVHTQEEPSTESNNNQADPRGFTPQNNSNVQHTYTPQNNPNVPQHTTSTTAGTPTHTQSTPAPQTQATPSVHRTQNDDSQQNNQSNQQSQPSSVPQQQQQSYPAPNYNQGNYNQGGGSNNNQGGNGGGGGNGGYHHNH